MLVTSWGKTSMLTGKFVFPPGHPQVSVTVKKYVVELIGETSMVGVVSLVLQL